MDVDVDPMELNRRRIRVLQAMIRARVIRADDVGTKRESVFC